MLRALAAIAVLSACHSYAQRTRDSTPVSVLATRAAYRELLRGEITHAQLAQRTNPLADDVVVRHRRVLDENIVVAAADAVGGLFAGPAPPPAAQPLESQQPKEPEKLVIEQWIELESEDIARVVDAIHKRVAAEGGRIVSENVIGAGPTASSAALELRVPPETALAFGSWLGTLATATSTRALASDVGKTLVDQQLALDNLRVTMARLQKLAEKDTPIAGLLEIEKEMTRVRGEIEQLEGEQRWLLDRVAFATVTVTLTREGGPVDFAPHARLHPGPHIALLSLLDPGTRRRTRIGGGVTVHVQRYLTLDLDVFPAANGDSRAVIGTVGTALYSGFLGNGGRAWGNPYVGARLGYGYLSGASATVVEGEVGIELYKQRYLLVEAAARAVAFVHDGSADVALHALLGFEIPF